MPSPFDEVREDFDLMVRGITDNAFRLATEDKDAPQKFAAFISTETVEADKQAGAPLGTTFAQLFDETVGRAAETTAGRPMAAQPQPATGLQAAQAAAEARIADPSEQQPTFATRPDAPGPVALAGTALQNIATVPAALAADILGIGPQEFRQAITEERAGIRAERPSNPLQRALQQIESELFAPATAFRATRGDFPQIGVPNPVSDDPLFHLGTAELLEAVADPLNFAGPGSIALRGAGARAAGGVRRVARELGEAGAELGARAERAGLPSPVSVAEYGHSLRGAPCHRR